MPEPVPDSVGETTLDARIGQILDDVCARRARGEAVGDAEVLAAHPDLAEALGPHLVLVRDLRRELGPREDYLLRLGILTPTPGGGYVGRLGGYRVDGLIGRGGMGIVYRGYDEALRRPVALKVLTPGRTPESSGLARFEREARTAAALRHPNIVGIYAIGREQGVPFIAMEYVDGPSLAEVIRGAWASGPYFCSHEPEAHAPRVRRIFRELLMALDAAHRARLIHRDVKSSNILLDVGSQARRHAGTEKERGSQDVSRSDGGDGSSASRADAQLGAAERVEAYAPLLASCLRASVPPCLPLVKLADFGLARMRDSQTQVTLEGSVLGTPEYMSPEQARGEPDIDHRTDLYSAGVVLYEMLTGRTPFRCDTPTATIRRILDEEPRDPRRLDKRVDPVLASLALRLMAKRREDRFASAGEVIAALDAGTRVRTPRRRGQRRWLGIAAAAGVVVLAVAGAAGWWSRYVTRAQIPAATRRITKIERSKDHKDLLACYGNSSVRERLLWLEQSSYRVFIPEPVIANLAGGRQVIVVGCHDPLDTKGSTLVAFDPNGRELWRLNPMPLPPRRWPDVPDAWYWRPTAFATGNLDGLPGDELVVVANHPGDYPTRLSVIDAETSDTRSTVWHFGQLQEGLAIVDCFFGDHEPAVVAWGQSNKLDGFEDSLRGPERQFAHWDKVLVVMVLRPDHMDGLAPPPVDPQRLAELGWPAVEPARVWAYAFLDLPNDDHERYVPSANPRIAIPEWRDAMPDAFAVNFKRVFTSPALPGACLELYTAIGAADATNVYSPRLELDQNLTLLDLGATAPDAYGKRGTDRAFWEPYWRVIMHDGQYVETQPGQD